VQGISQVKGLRDVRTTISTQVRACPRTKGSTYLEVYRLDKEKQRLEMVLLAMAKQQQRINRRLGEIREAVARLMDGQKEVAAAPRKRTARGHSEAKEAGPRWKKLTLGY